MQLQLFRILIVVGAAMGCSQTPPRAPIVDAKPIPSYRLQHHDVAPGETLYSIAWRYDLDYRALAAGNGIDPARGLRPGQRLRLEVAAVPPPTPKSPPSAPPRSIKRSPPQRTAPAKTAKTNTIEWVWPVSGRVHSGFRSNSGLNKGIDIRAELGESVRAAAAGEVVYAGSGLRGYGNLVIVKHDSRFLSAYAYNQALMVREGEKVAGAQVIAKVGVMNSGVSGLHFEIRKDGEPQNPLQLLPPQ